MLHLLSVSVNSGIFHSSQPLQSSPFPIWSTFNWSPTLSFLLQNCPLNPASPVHSLSLPEFRSSSSSIWTYSNRKTWPPLFFLSQDHPPHCHQVILYISFSCCPWSPNSLGRHWKFCTSSWNCPSVWWSSWTLHYYSNPQCLLMSSCLCMFRHRVWNSLPQLPHTTNSYSSSETT